MQKSLRGGRRAIPGERSLPPHLQTLWPGEREFANIVFARGPVTAVEVQERLSKPLSKSAVRATLTRLTNKGVIECRPGRRGRGCPAVYLPTTIPDHVKAEAVAKLARDYFHGSSVDLALAALDAVTDGPEDLRVLASKIAARAGENGLLQA